jgi:hypothetical protein
MYQKVLNILKQHTDKVFHFVAGMAILEVVSIFCPFWVALIAVLLAGVSKETRDQIVYRGWDWIDLLATVAGGLFSFACILIRVWCYSKGFVIL